MPRPSGLVVQPRSLEKVSTRYGQSDAVKARVSVIDGSGKPADYPDTLIFPKLLLAQTRDKLGEKVLGRLGKGVAKPGQGCAVGSQRAIRKRLPDRRGMVEEAGAGGPVGESRTTLLGIQGERHPESADLLGDHSR
jgi:hypothetical protein